MKKLFLSVIGLSLIIPSLVFAGEIIEGTIQGYNCVTQGRCAASSEDPIVTTEYAFVVVTPEGKYYFLPNVPRAVLAYRDTERVRVKGDISPKYNKIDTQWVQVVKKEKWTVVWNRDSEFNPIPELYK